MKFLNLTFDFKPFYRQIFFLTLQSQKRVSQDLPFYKGFIIICHNIFIKIDVKLRLFLLLEFKYGLLFGNVPQVFLLNIFRIIFAVCKTWQKFIVPTVWNLKSHTTCKCIG